MEQQRATARDLARWSYLKYPPPIVFTRDASKRYGMVSSHKGKVHCLACDAFFDDLMDGQTHPCPKEQAFRQKTGRFPVTMATGVPSAGVRYIPPPPPKVVWSQLNANAKYVFEAWSRYGMLIGITHSVYKVRCLACERMFEQWSRARAHSCPNEAAFRKKTGRLTPEQRAVPNYLISTSAETQQVAAKLAPHGGGQPNTLAEALAFIEYMAKELKAARRRLTAAEEVIGKQAKALEASPLNLGPEASEVYANYRKLVG